MENARSYSLAALTITTALTSQAQTAIDELEGMTSVTIEAEFSGGTGGTSLTALVQTRIGSGGTWREIASFDFTTAASKSCNIVANGSAAIAALAALSANTVLQGFLGTELRAVITSVGTYTDSTLAVRASVR